MTTRKTSTTRKAAPRKTTTTSESIETTEITEQMEAMETPVEKTQPKRAVKATAIDHNELIPCRSTQKNLTYISKRTNERIEWEEFGEVQYVSFGELITMRGTQKRFFSEGWIIVDDEEAVNQLGLTKQYEDMFDIDELDKFFRLSLGEMERVLVKMPRGFKNSLAVEARERIEDGTLDSRNVIKLLEKHLDVDLKIFE